MMEKYFFLFLIVFHISQCHKQMRNNQLNGDECKNIKCPNEDKPVCVQVTNKSMKNKKPTYVIMINECEMEYMKCHQGLSATLVPMEKCGHDDLKNIQTVLKAKKTKRDHLVVRKVSKPSSNKTRKLQDDTNDQDNDDYKAASSDESHQRNDESKAESSDLDDTQKADSKTISDESHQYNELKAESSDKSNAHKDEFKAASSNENNSNNGEFKAASSHENNPHNGEFKAASSHENNSYNDDFKAASPDESDQDNNEQGDIKKKGNNFEDNDEKSGNNEDEVLKRSQESSHSDTHAMVFDDKPDREHQDYQAVCPKSCPVRDVMVCAKCHHGIYKTFISVCHMRMFNCQHKGEVLELVAREPCMMSAPYIDDESSQPNQRISEPNDDDKVLAYIVCREKLNDVGLQNLEYNYYSKCDFNRDSTDPDMKI